MLAIIVPYYKLAFFEATLQSLAHQTDKRFKVYIGDDASPENPVFLLEKYKEAFVFEYHRFETNLGGVSLVRQWERCLDRVGDEKWIMILGDDDLLDANCVASFYEAQKEIEEKKINVVRYATVVIDQNGKALSKVHHHPQYESSIDFLMRKLLGGTRSSLSEYIFKFDVLKKIRFKDIPLAWYSDLLAVLEVSDLGLLYTINDSVVSFRLSGQNITSQTDNLVLKNIGTFQFYYYLLCHKFDFFTAEQKQVLLYRIEKTFLDNKKNIDFWVKLTRFYVSKGLFLRFFLLFPKCLKNSIHHKL